MSEKLKEIGDSLYEKLPTKELTLKGASALLAIYGGMLLWHHSTSIKTILSNKWEECWKASGEISVIAGDNKDSDKDGNKDDNKDDNKKGVDNTDNRAIDNVKHIDEL